MWKVHPKRLVCQIWCLLLILATEITPQCAELQSVPGSGFVEEEGEYLPDPYLSGLEKLKIDVECNPNGGTATFHLLQDRLQYRISDFPGLQLRPLDHWLLFESSWPSKSGQRVPEESRLISAMMMDGEIGTCWVGALCAYISEKEGWDHLNPIPWEIRDNYASVAFIDKSSTIFHSYTSAQLKISSSSLSLYREEYNNIRSLKKDFQYRAAYMFEGMVSAMARGGYIEGIPRGVIELDMKYHEFCGLDGCFILSKDIYYLEDKLSDKGRLSQIVLPNGEVILELNFSWVCRDILRTLRENDGVKFKENMIKVQGSGQHDLMRVVQYINEHQEDFKNDQKITQDFVVENFSELDKVFAYVKKRMGSEIVNNIGNWIKHDVHLILVNESGKNVGYLRALREDWGAVERMTYDQTKDPRAFLGESVIDRIIMISIKSMLGVC